MKIEDLFTAIACFILWGLAFVILATTPMVVTDADKNCIKVIPSSAGSCDALPKRYELFGDGVKKTVSINQKSASSGSVYKGSNEMNQMEKS